MEMVEGSRVLDIGCNAGMFASRLAARGHQVTGVELEQSLLDIAIKRHGRNEALRFVKISDEGLGFEDSSFDCVTILEVLEHVREVWALVGEIRRVLKPGGKLVLSVPNAASIRIALKSLAVNPRKRLVEMNDWPDYVPDHRDHVHMWDIFTLYRMLNLRGFRYVAHDYFDANPRMRFACRIIPPLKKLSSSFLLKLSLEK